MIVQCPSCASRYRIRDANIPPSGGKIRCPSCSHSFIVYPESEDEDRTSITSQGEISHLVNKMAGSPGGSGLDADQEDYVSTQISTTDESRAMAAAANELGNPLDMDGTVEIQNPMKVWREAQNAMAAARAANLAPPDDETGDETGDDYGDHAPTEVVDPSALSFPAQAPQESTQEDFNPTAIANPPPERSDAAFAPTQAQPAVQGPPNPQHYQQPQHEYSPPPGPQRHDSTPGSDEGYSSGQYAPNTPPGGRHTHESWDQVQQPAQRPQQQFGSSPGFDRSPSGLTSAALFDDMPDDDSIPHVPARQDPGIGAGPGYGAPAPASTGGGGGGGVNPEHPGPWKLKTNFGLTYEFPDTRGLRSWLSSREELDGFTVSADDGGSFHPLSTFPQLDRGGRNPSTSGIMAQPQSYGSGSFTDPGASGQHPQAAHERTPSHSGLDSSYSSGLHTASPGDNPTTGIKGPRVNSEYRPPSRESKSKGLLWLVFLLLIVVAGAIALETFGIFKLSDVARNLGIMPSATNPSKTAPTPTDQQANADVPEIDHEELAKKQAGEVERLLEDAERLIEGNKLPAALEMLRTSEQLAPDNILVHDLKARVHDKLGQSKKAEAARAKAEELRAAGFPEPETDGTATDDDGEPEEPAPDNAE